MVRLLSREYEWSSYRGTAGLDAAPEWLDVAAALAWLGADPADEQTAYRRFVLAAIDRDAEAGGVVAPLDGSPQDAARHRPAEIRRSRQSPRRGLGSSTKDPACSLEERIMLPGGRAMFRRGTVAVPRGDAPCSAEERPTSHGGPRMVPWGTHHGPSGTHQGPTGNAPGPHGGRTMSPWATHRVPMGDAPCSHGGRTMSPWGTHRVPMGTHRVPMGDAPCPHGGRTMSPWGTHRVPKGMTAVPRGLPRSSSHLWSHSRACRRPSI
jgi:hypothetical protein